MKFHDTLAIECQNIVNGKDVPSSAEMVACLRDMLLSWDHTSVRFLGQVEADRGSRFSPSLTRSHLSRPISLATRLDPLWWLGCAEMRRTPSSPWKYRNARLRPVIQHPVLSGGVWQVAVATFLDPVCFLLIKPDVGTSLPKEFQPSRVMGKGREWKQKLNISNFLRFATTSCTGSQKLPHSY